MKKGIKEKNRQIIGDEIGDSFGLFVTNIFLVSKLDREFLEKQAHRGS